MLEQIIGKKSYELTERRFLDLCATYQTAWVDLGTGDGMFALRAARKEPSTLMVGLDADRGSLSVASIKARKKPASGGAPNVIFLCANLMEKLPDVFRNIFSRAYINFPWGSLLQSVVEVDKNLFGGVRSILQEGGRLEITLNMHVLADAAQRKALRLPDFTSYHVENVFLPSLFQQGFRCLQWSFVGREIADLLPSTWAGRLVKSSGRESLRMVFEVSKDAVT